MSPAIIPKPGCKLRQVYMGPAPVVVECRTEEQEFADGRAETFWVIEGALINGVYVPYSDEMLEWFERWSEQLADEAQAQAEDIAESLAFDAYRERAERMGWAA